MFQWPKYLSPKCYSSSSKCQLLTILLLDHYLCVCVCARACVRASTFMSVKQHKQVYLYPTLAKALFIHHSSQTINFLDFIQFGTV